MEFLNSISQRCLSIYKKILLIPKYLLRDRDGIYGKVFQNRVRGMGIEEIKIAAKSPWQNPYCERMIGSIRRDCVNHRVALNVIRCQAMIYV